MTDITKIKKLLEKMSSANLEIVLREVMFRFKRRTIEETLDFVKLSKNIKNLKEKK